MEFLISARAKGRCTKEYGDRFGYDRVTHIDEFVRVSRRSHNVDIEDSERRVKDHLEDRVESH
jgi:hypothetical protein